MRGYRPTTAAFGPVSPVSPMTDTLLTCGFTGPVRLVRYLFARMSQDSLNRRGLPPRVAGPLESAMDSVVYVVVPLAVTTVVAATTVTVVIVALRGTIPQERVAILRAIADLIHAVWHTHQTLPTDNAGTSRDGGSDAPSE